MFEDMFGWFSSDDSGSSAVINPVNDQEALGRGIVEQAIYDQSAADLATANDRAASSFEGQYQHATAGPEYDPTEADPYGFQQILGRAIVQQSTPQHLVDDSPLNRIGSADVSAWATQAAGALRSFVSTPTGPGTAGNVPRQVFSNRPGQGGGYVITPSRGAGASTSSGKAIPSPLLLVGLVAVGAYLAFK
ncbi:MAG: hypothetical protein Q7U76_11300 [Nitrospirota bacterium]|nr:hypothetical protein [Nitrospirota bacterium]